MKHFSVIIVVVLLFIVGYFALQGYLSRGQKVPGLVMNKLTPCGSKPNSVCSQEGTDSDHFIKPISLSVANLSSVVSVIESLGGKIIVLEQDYLAAEFRSSIFGFVDDFELLRDASAGVIHVRSASRVGYSDMGVNRKRVESFRSDLENNR